MSESELRRLVLQSARNARRLYRAADSAGEKLERWLDREISRKTRIREAQAAKGVPLFEDYRAKVQALERGMADLMSATLI